MGLAIPGDLADLLGELGYTWPKTDESLLLDLAQDWVGFGAPLSSVAAEAGSIARAVLADNGGLAMEAFRGTWERESGGHAVLSDGAVGVQTVGATMIVCAAVVLALKVNVIVQITILAIQILQAVLTAAATGGLSLLELPMFKLLTEMAVDFLIGEAVAVVLG